MNLLGLWVINIQILLDCFVKFVPWTDGFIEVQLILTGYFDFLFDFQLGKSDTEQ